MISWSSDEHVVQLKETMSDAPDHDARGDGTAVDPFLQAMTFTQGRRFLPSCDCDECGVQKQNVIPAPIRSAVAYHNRKRRLKRTQLRELVYRGKDVVLWKWTMPCASEPLIEYGNPNMHRLIWVHRLSSNMVLKSIGSGVIGSAAEEKTRETMPWVQGGVIHLKCQAAKAVGWIAANNKADESQDVSPIVLCIAKVAIPNGSTQINQDERLLRIWQLCNSMAVENKNENEPYYRAGKELSAEDADSFRNIFRSFLD